MAKQTGELGNFLGGVKMGDLDLWVWWGETGRFATGGGRMRRAERWVDRTRPSLI